MRTNPVGLLRAVALALLCTMLPWQASAAPSPSDEAIITIKKVSGGPPGTAWDVTLPPGTAGRLQDQAWLVVDGHSEGFGGYDIPPLDDLKLSHHPLRLYADINNSLDGEVKDILKAQGLAVKDGLTTYRVQYGVRRPYEYSGPETLHFRNSAAALAYRNDWLPQTARYRVGDRITLFDAEALDSTALHDGAAPLADLQHGFKTDLPLDLAHHIMIQIQFLRVTPDGKLVQTSIVR